MPKKPTQYWPIIGVRVNPEMKKAIARAAKERDQRPSDFIRAACARALATVNPPSQ